MAVDGWFWTVQGEDSQEKIIGGVILIYIRYSEQSVIWPKEEPHHQEIFENGWLSKDASEQSKIAAWNVIRFLPIKIYVGILLYRNT